MKIVDDVDRDMLEGLRGLAEMGIIEPIDKSQDDPEVKFTKTGKMLVSLIVKASTDWMNVQAEKTNRVANFLDQIVSNKGGIN